MEEILAELKNAADRIILAKDESLGFLKEEVDPGFDLLKNSIKLLRAKLHHTQSTNAFTSSPYDLALVGLDLTDALTEAPLLLEESKQLLADGVLLEDDSLRDMDNLLQQIQGLLKFARDLRANVSKNHSDSRRLRSEIANLRIASEKSQREIEAMQKEFFSLGSLLNVQSEFLEFAKRKLSELAEDRKSALEGTLIQIQENISVGSAMRQDPTLEQMLSESKDMQEKIEAKLRDIIRSRPSR